MLSQPSAPLINWDDLPGLSYHAAAHRGSTGDYRVLLAILALVRRGGPPSWTLGRKVVYTKSDVKRWLDDQLTANMVDRR